MSLGPIGPKSAGQPASRNWVADVYGKPGATPSLAPANPALRKDLVAGVVPGSIMGPSASAQTPKRVDVVDLGAAPSRVQGLSQNAEEQGVSTGVYSMYRRPADRVEAAVGVELGRRLDVRG